MKYSLNFNKKPMYSCLTSSSNFKVIMQSKTCNFATDLNWMVTQNILEILEVRIKFKLDAETQFFERLLL